MSPRVLAATLLLLATGPGASRAEDPAARVAADAAGVVVLRGARVGGPVPPPEPPAARRERREERLAPEVTVVIVPIERTAVYAAPAWGVVPFAFFEHRHPRHRLRHAGFAGQSPAFGHRAMGRGRGFGGSVPAGRP